MFPGAPRTFITLLALVVGVRLLLVLLSPGSVILPVIQDAFIGFVSWQALRGKESAAKALAVLLLLGAALDTFALIGAVSSGARAALIFLAIPLFHVGVAAYVFRSHAVKQFFVSKARSGMYAPFIR